MANVGGTDSELIIAALRKVGALTHFPPGLLPLMASFLGPDLIFLAGGVIRGAVSTAVCYSPHARSWCTNVPSMITARYGPATVAIGSRMMVFGGTGRNGWHLASCEVFDLKANKWSALPPMSEPRVNASAVAWRGISLERDNVRVFIFGGLDGSTVLSSVECFDSKLNRWSAMAPMPTPRSDTTAVAVSGCGLLVMGGYNGGDHDGRILQSVQCYDPATNRWTAMSWQLPKPLFDFAAHCIDRTLYVLGGFSPGFGYVTDCWSMDLGADVPIWSALPPLPTKMAGLASVVL